MAGWIKIYRDIQEHWIWQDANKLKWWLDIILMANHKDNKFLLGNELFEVKRGEFHTSELKLAERWNVSKKSVRSFLELLERDHMVELNKSKKGTTIKVSNYNDYQANLSMEGTTEVPCRNHEGTILEPQKNHEGTTEVPQRNHEGYTNKNEKNNKNDKECIKNEKESKNEKNEENKKHIEQQVAYVWNRYPLKKGKATAIKKIPKLIEQYSYEQLIRCIERYELGLQKETWRKPQNGSTFFNSGYVDYLDENYQEVEIVVEQHSGYEFQPKSPEMIAFLEGE
ncbi:MAG: hypothetical protein E6590_16445 [Clostridiales bacterium]|uniref:Uncharacterized protein n=1 Tax=Zhenhengia yiwuensis TaxID=2763666 RepID=A0A926IFS8_9FIRM|nr:hypothetical protein [Zhenhengia yiwuensis]MBC8581349.1 hypothetical protein [Zhenhengia yiwuensis]MDU6361521.1 hypothetical protein [Clostridiales bacterium]